MLTGEKTGFMPYEMRISLIQVISYEDRNIRGFLSNPYFKEEQYFGSLTQLILLIERMLDDLKYPQKDMESRNFGKPDHTWEPVSCAAVPAERHILASFQLKILFRQNASWQGSLIWNERMVESSFRSVLELMMLMDSALTAKP